jgi:5-methylcytosine-specific restriction enzyme subunit McrC
VSEIHIRLQEWDSVGPDNIPALLGFHFDDAADRRQAEELSQAGTLQFHELYDGLRIRARAHVGRVRLGRLTVTVTPKIGETELLTLFRYAYGLRGIKRLATASYSATGDLFQDLVIAQLYAEVQDLLERGIARTYVERNEDLASPRGKIDVARLASPSRHASAELPCRHYPRSTDHLLNRTVLAGLTLAQAMVDDRSLRLAVSRQCRLMTELAGPEALSAELLLRAKRRLNRLVAPYTSIVQLIEILYFGTVVDLEAEGGRRSLPGFLFDMNRFFQRLIERFLSENLSGAQVESEFGLTQMMRYVPGHNPRGRSSPRPRPDYAIKKQGRVVSLLDAKYRDLWETNLPREMLYQLTVYALSQGHGATAAILYPAIDPGATPSLIEIREPSGGASTGYVALRPVHLGRMVQLIEDDELPNQLDCERWATALAGLA